MVKPPRSLRRDGRPTTGRHDAAQSPSSIESGGGNFYADIAVKTELCAMPDARLQLNENPPRHYNNCWDVCNRDATVQYATHILNIWHHVPVLF